MVWGWPLEGGGSKGNRGKGIYGSWLSTLWDSKMQPSRSFENPEFLKNYPPSPVITC